MQLTRETLKPFQLRAADELAQKLQTYPNPPYTKWFRQDTGDPYPFICRLKAITGSGKTPMLAVMAATLGDAIILWTTNRSVVISQTIDNFSADGSYAPLLPEDTQLHALSDLAPTDWTEMLTARTGLTIVLGTVSLFNRDDAGKESLNLHKERNGTSYWEMLAGKGPDGRLRPLYVVYDEAHGTTKAQFGRLTELDPYAFILASASPLPDGLAELIPGSTSEEKSAALEHQTVVVNTAEVVEAGLLKTRLYLVDCNTTREQAVRDANDKWLELRRKVPCGEGPIWCGVVNSTLAGLEVWAVLTKKMGVAPERIAVHLANIDANVAAAGAAAGATANWALLQDTKKAGKTPEQLRADGYTHIIWNLSLREGWDEPWAYVAYLDSTGKSAIDISQKIGRFLRQPNATPFADGDLNSAYFYFNVPDKDFATLVQATQNDLQNEGYEVITISGDAARPGASRLVAAKEAIEIPMVAESFGEDLELLDAILLDAVPSFSPESLKAPGKVKTKVIDVRRNQEDGALEKVEQRTENADILVWKYLLNRLKGIDSRPVNRFSHELNTGPKMRQRMHYGSEAMRMLNEALPTIQQKLNAEFRLEYEPDKTYKVGPFNMSSPDLRTDDPVKRERYAVRSYKHALHAEYNGLNPFEAEVATALDQLGNTWCRNPSKTGYGIPIPVLGEGTTNFYPDFLLWGSKTLWAIDPKGKHILDNAILTKLYGLGSVPRMPQLIRVALVVEGDYIIGPDNRPQRRGKDGCTLIWKDNDIVKANQFASPEPLIKYLATR